MMSPDVFAEVIRQKKEESNELYEKYGLDNLNSKYHNLRGTRAKRRVGKGSFVIIDNSAYGGRVPSYLVGGGEIPEAVFRSKEYDLPYISVKPIKYGWVRTCDVPEGRGGFGSTDADGVVTEGKIFPDSKVTVDYCELDSGHPIYHTETLAPDYFRDTALVKRFKTYGYSLEDFLRVVNP